MTDCTMQGQKEPTHGVQLQQLVEKKWKGRAANGRKAHREDLDLLEWTGYATEE